MENSQSENADGKRLKSAAEWLNEMYGFGISAESGADRTTSLRQQDDVRVDEQAKGLEAQLIRQKELRNNELEQRIKNQERFFKFALTIIGAPVAAAAIGFIFLIFNERAGDVTYAAFFASVVAEVIGLSYILGNYFFPHQKNSDKDTSGDD